MSCITLLSDLGTNDASIASAKGILLQEVPEMQVIDISHNVEPFNLQHAAYTLRTSFNNFPAATIHLILYDTFYNDEPKLILAESDGHYFLAPDNNILNTTLRQIDRCWLVDNMPINVRLTDWVRTAGRICRELSSGKKTPADIGLAEYKLELMDGFFRPNIYPDHIECHIIHVDSFGNVILNVTRDEFEKARNGRIFSIRFMRDETVTTISENYNSVKEGYKLCRFNSSGYLEIAVYKGKAARLYGLSAKKDRQLIYRTIKIEFE